MFSTSAELAKKTGPDGIDRCSFLKQLVDEFRKTTSQQAKREVLANLANFAYDPVNYEFIKQLGIIDLFLEQLSESNEELVHFGLAGVCNLSSDPEIRSYMVRLNAVFLVSQLLLHRHEEISLNALTSLIFLITPETQASITTPEIISKVLTIQNREDTRFKNLSTIFLQDFCTLEQITQAKSVTNIPNT